MVSESNLFITCINHQSGSFLSLVFDKFTYYLVQVFHIVDPRMKSLKDQGLPQRYLLFEHMKTHQQDLFKA